MTATRSELQAWLDAYAPIKDAPDAQTLADFLGIKLAPEPAPAAPVGQRRRSPDGTEVVKTDGVSALCWQRYAGVGKAWFSDDAIADWQIVTDAPDCDREHLPDGHVPITFHGWSDDDLKVAARVVGSGGLGAAIRAELTNRGDGHASVTTVWSTELDLSPDANWEDATAEEEMA